MGHVISGVTGYFLLWLATEAGRVTICTWHIAVIFRSNP